MTKPEDFELHYRLELDVHCNCDNIKETLSIISENIRKQFTDTFNPTVVSITPTVYPITIKKEEE